MSHFLTVVLIPEDGNAHDHVHELLAPYDENLEDCPAHEEECYCVHEGKAELTCEECSGSGRYMSTSNPRGYWDYWLIGGRWQGVFQQERVTNEEYDQDTRDRDALVQAFTGKTVGERLAGDMGRPDMAANIDRLMGRGGYGSVDPEQAAERIERRHAACIVPAGAYLSLLDSKPPVGRESEDRFGTPFALVTPDGEWHSQGRMGWWGHSSDELSDEAWLERCRSLVSANLNCRAVACDLHV